MENPNQKETVNPVDPVEAVKERREKAYRFTSEEFNAAGPIPHPVIRGYYYVFGIDNDFVINRKGDIIDLRTGRPRTTFFSTKGYVQTSVKINGLHRTVGVHRLVAKTFIKIPEHLMHRGYDELTVNHVDGVKTNNDVSNLEWMTAEENSVHGRKNNLIPSGELGVLAKNVTTNDVIEHRSIQIAARFHSINETTLQRHLGRQNTDLSRSDGSTAGLVICNGYVYKMNDGQPWPEGTPMEITTGSNGLFGDCVAENVETGERQLHSSMNKACEYIGLDREKVNNWRKYHGGDIPYQNWIFYRLSSRPIYLSTRRGRLTAL